ncbi:MAG: hypothetical protein HOO06_08240 [Bdellovibrionaceae bacterium]|jgi:hypothetical protein|nr:hypothetical protein [Pseudobdellovibrionaceae bacterium]
MKTTITTIFAILALSQSAVAAGWGQGSGNSTRNNWKNNETVVSKTLLAHQKGRGQTIGVLRELKLKRNHRGQVLKSVIVLAKSKQGRGKVLGILNGQSISRQEVGQSLEPVVINVDQILGGRNQRRGGVRTMQIETNGNIIIHSIQAVVSSEQSFGVSVDATVNRDSFSLEADNKEELLRDCMQTLRNKKSERPRFSIKRVVANGMRMEIYRGENPRIAQACKFIAQQAN